MTITSGNGPSPSETPGSGPPASGPSAGADDGIAVIPFTGVVDLDAAATMTVHRLVDARLHRADLVGVPLRYVIIDLSGVRRIDPRALRPLADLRRSAARRQVGVHLVGLGGASATLPPDARHLLAALGCHPTVDVARAALGSQPAPRSRVDCIDLRGIRRDPGPAG
jgi:anti-anti-sigma regulatory factor